MGQSSSSEPHSKPVVPEASDTRDVFKEEGTLKRVQGIVLKGL